MKRKYTQRRGPHQWKRCIVCHDISLQHGFPTAKCQTFTPPVIIKPKARRIIRISRKRAKTQAICGYTGHDIASVFGSKSYPFPSDYKRSA